MCNLMSFFICLKLDSTSRDIMKRVFAIWNKFVDQGELNFVRILCIRAIWYWLGFSFIKSHRGMECDWKTLTDLLYACECCNSCDGYFIVLSDTLKKAQKKSSDRVLLSKVSPPGWEETRFFSLTLLPK